ncbi:MAG: hypothetical protein WC519_02995 [Parcubacteria group bacterium]
MKESTQRLLVSLGSLVLLAAALYVYAALIRPQYAVIQELRGKRQTITTLLADYETAVQEKNKVLARFESISGLQESFSEVVPPKENIPSLLNQLYGLAKLNDITIDSIEFQELPIQTTTAKSLVKPYGTVQATVRCASKYDDMKKYLSAIETNVRLLNVVSLNVTGGFQTNPTLSYTVTVEAYYLTE